MATSQIGHEASYKSCGARNRIRLDRPSACPGRAAGRGARDELAPARFLERRGHHPGAARGNQNVSVGCVRKGRQRAWRVWTRSKRASRARGDTAAHEDRGVSPGRTGMRSVAAEPRVRVWLDKDRGVLPLDINVLAGHHESPRHGAGHAGGRAHRGRSGRARPQP